LIIGILMADGLEQNRICVPSEIDTKTALQIFLTQAANENHKDIEGTATMFRALVEKYPCEKK
jgi:hypothetical protein